MWMVRVDMMKSVIELAKNGNVVVDAEHAGAVCAMAQSVGIIACGGALIKCRAARARVGVVGRGVDAR